MVYIFINFAWFEMVLNIDPNIIWFWIIYYNFYSIAHKYQKFYTFTILIFFKFMMIQKIIIMFVLDRYGNWILEHVYKGNIQHFSFKTELF